MLFPDNTIFSVVKVKPKAINGKVHRDTNDDNARPLTSHLCLIS